MKTFQLLSLLPCLFFTAFCTAQFTPIGLDIDGESTGDNSGRAVSMNSNGTILAIGAPLSNGSATSAGQVRVYEWNGSAWIQKGNDIDASSSYGEFGSAVSLDASGTLLAVGAPKYSDNLSNAGQVTVYEWNGMAWTPKGLPINGQNSFDELGSAVVLSENGSTLAIGSPLSDDNGSESGSVLVYEWSNNAWTQKGGKLIGDSQDDWLGSAVSLNGTGTVLAVGVPNGQSSNAFPLSSGGHAKVYEWTGTTWSQRGGNLYGDGSCGSSVSLSGNGNTVAVGAPYDQGTLIGTGRVRISEWGGSSWTQIGTDIEGDQVGDGFGTSVSLSGNATVVAIGAHEDGSTNDKGYTKVYERSGSGWSQRSVDIEAENLLDLFGTAVSVSKDGTTLAVGGPFNDGSGVNAGHVRVFDLTSFSIHVDKINHELEVTVWPNPTTDYLFVDKKDYELLSLELVDGLGRRHQAFQATEQVSTVNLRDLPTGIYFLKIRKDNQLMVKKISKQ